MATPLISILMPVYNAARWLRTALDSISKQTLTDFECVVVNDGSTDRSLDVLRQHAAGDPRFHVITRANTGLIGALNDALAVARGPYLARMDADDLAEPTRLARQVESFESEPALVALGTAVTFMDANGRRVQDCPRPLEHAEIEQQLLSGDGGTLIHPSVMFRSAAVRNIGGYRIFQPDAQYFEDLDLYLRLARVGRLANLAAPLLRYRVHPGSVNFTVNPKRHAVKLAVMREAYAVRGLSFHPQSFTAQELHRDPVRHAREWAATALAFGSRRVAIGHGWRAVWRRPQDAANWRALRYALTAPLPTSRRRTA